MMCKKLGKWSASWLVTLLCGAVAATGAGSTRWPRTRREIPAFGVALGCCSQGRAKSAELLGSGISRSLSTTDEVQTLEEGSQDELVYTLGVNLARQLGDIRPLVESPEELALVARGLLDAVVGRIEDDEQRDLLKRRGAELNEFITNRANKLRDRIEEAGRTMLEEMAKTDGIVKVLDSGVVVHFLDAGEAGEFGVGVRPTVGSTVKVNYHGTLPDGSVFDSTLIGPEAKPAQFALGQVISGWRDALMQMTQGETVMVGIPPEAGYGEQGSPDGRIPGNCPIFFKIQLLEVVTAGVGGLVGMDGQSLRSAEGKDGGSSGLLGADGNPL